MLYSGHNSVVANTPIPAAPLDRLLSVALQASPSGLIALQLDGSVLLLTGGAATLMGLEGPSDWCGMPISFVLAHAHSLSLDGVQALSAILECCDGEPSSVVISSATTVGSQSVRVDIWPAPGRGWILSLEDVTRHRQAQDWLLEHASTDPVTGLWNRQHFLLMVHDRLISAPPPHSNCRPGPSHALLLIGLRRFKQVNDLFGLRGGDAVLRMVGQRLGSRLGEDDLLARFAGEEFAVFISREGPHAVFQDLVDRLCAALSAPYLLEGQPVAAGAHIGIAYAPDHGATTETLIANAGLALAETAKRGGASLCVFEPSLTDRARLHRALEADLRLALARGEFELHYQPQVDVRRNCVTGLEALIRWRSPVRGLVPPTQFIPLAEQTGLINDIGDWVLHEACRAAVHWPADVTIAINASPLQFETGCFARTVGEALAETGLPASRLEIEITESLLLRDTGTVTATLAALHAMGVRLVLDDFGTGYASLSQISRFRFDKIKIDRSFVSPIDESVENAAIVRSIAALGTSLGIPTTAEGVETAKQLEQIKADGCTSVQGYYFSRPVPAGEVDIMLDRLHRPAVCIAA